MKSDAFLASVVGGVGGVGGMEKFTSLRVDWKELVPVLAKSLVLVARDTYRDATQLRASGNAHRFL